MSEEMFFNHIGYTLIFIAGIILVNYLIRIKIVQTYLSLEKPFITYDKDIATLMKLVKDKDGKIQIIVFRKLLLGIIPIFYVWTVGSLFQMVPSHYDVTSRIFATLIGSIVLLYSFILLIALETLHIFRNSKNQDIVAGQIQWVRWFSIRIGASRLLRYGFLCLFLYCVTGSYFLLGGGLSCLVASLEFYIKSYFLRKKTATLTT